MAEADEVGPQGLVAGRHGELAHTRATTAAASITTPPAASVAMNWRRTLGTRRPGRAGGRLQSTRAPSALGAHGGHACSPRVATMTIADQASRLTHHRSGCKDYGTPA